MYGNILYGGSSYGDTVLGIFIAEAGPNISKSSSRVIFRSIGVLSVYPGRSREPATDITINLFARELNSKIGFGVYGNFDEFGTTAIQKIGFGTSGVFIPSRIVAKGPAELYHKVKGDFTLTSPFDNSIQWSNIGSLDFDIGADNVAGNMPLDFSGYVYAIKQLGTSNIIIVYNENGITSLHPKDIYFGRKKVHSVGIKSKHAVCEVADTHFFVDAFGELFSLSSQGLKKLGYKEFLSGLNDLAISYNQEFNFLHLCDGTTGYIYSISEDSLTKGPSSITGSYYRGGESLLFSSEALSALPFELCTDEFDFGTRKEKTIINLEVDFLRTQKVYAAIDFKHGLDTAFTTTPWIEILQDGMVHLPCHGNSFRIRLKSDEALIDSYLSKIKINGVVEGYKPTDLDERF